MIRPRDLPSPNYDDRPADGLIDILVIHYTGMRTAEDALARLIDPAAKVSAHYLIDEDGAIVRLVDESRRAWHAGHAAWRGDPAVNARSLGIELVNPGHEFGYRPFPESQMTALETLIRDILSRHAIPARNIIGHSDVAPTRKSDPGELFNWKRLAAAGIGLWPDHEESMAPGEIGPLLTAIGYDTTDLTAATIAFQRHFTPHRLDGVADAQTLRAATALRSALTG